MAIIKCRECGKEISTQADKCPHCGAKRKKIKLWLWIPLGLVVAFFGFGAIVGNTPEAKKKAQDRETIAFCWEEQSKKSNTQLESQFISKTCEQLENEFTTNYGHKP